MSEAQIHNGGANNYCNERGGIPGIPDDLLVCKYALIHEWMLVFRVRLCHCRGTLGISFVATPPPSLMAKREGDTLSHTTHRPFPWGGVRGWTTDKQQRRGGERGLRWVPAQLHTFRVQRLPF